MALRALMKRRELDRLNKDLEAQRAKQEELETREKELEIAINETETDEERKAVEDEVDNFEQERGEVEDAIKALEEKISAIEAELSEIEKSQEPAPAPAPKPEETDNKRGANLTMNKRNIFAKMAPERRSAIFEQEDVQSFIGRVRTAIKEKRAISNIGLLIPDVFLGVLRENIVDYSKLLKYTNLVRVSGEARQTIMGTIPEAVWTDCCGKINELDLDLYGESVDCWKVAGYFTVCNANLEDSDIDLASELLSALGYAIGYAIDKAIIFGLGTRMPLGVYTRLAQTAEPSDYPADSRPWADLHESNIRYISTSDQPEFMAEFIRASGDAKGKYSRGEKVWVMNETTYSELLATFATYDSTGAIVSRINGEMPVVGGKIELLEFMPDYAIVGGYFDNYLMAERAGTRLAQSEHVKFLDDQTVFKGVARYDGKPSIAEAFVAVVLGTDAITVPTFAPDSANESE